MICAESGSNVCANCVQDFGFRPTQISRQQIKDLKGFATCEYTQSVAKLVHEFKEGQQTSLVKIMTPAMSKALQNFNLENICLVPIPSKRKSFATRGFEPATVLAKALSRQIARDCNRLVPVKKHLKFSLAVADQASLSGFDRRLNLVGSMVATHPGAFAGVSPNLILVDDIVTTGSTLAEAHRCLTAVGAEVVGFVAFAETLPRNRQNGRKNSI